VTASDRPVCDRCGERHIRSDGTPSCTAHHQRDGKLCKAQPRRGLTVCKNHGGSTTRAKNAAATTIETARTEKALTRAVATLGLRRDINPVDALLEEVQWTAGHVAWLRLKVQELDETALQWGRTREKTGGDDHGTTHEARPHVVYALYDRERDKLVKACTAAINAGIAERQVRLAEAQGALVADAIRQILDALGLTPAQLEQVPIIVPRVLRAIGGTA
jgi:hypothetical protein